MDTQLETILSKAKLGLMARGTTFLMTVTFNLHHVFTERVPTAATDGISILYNPNFFTSLTPPQRISLIIHETWHVALLHNYRGQNHNKEIYNEAADYVINQLIKDAGQAPLPDWLQDDIYRGMSTNEVYDLIKHKPRPPNSPNDILQPSGEDTDSKDKERVEQIIMKASMAAEMQGEDPGNLPVDIQRLMDKLINPQLPWEQILGRFINDQSKNDYTWSRPNRRFLPEFYLPSAYSESLEHLVFAIDTSGSVTDDDMIAMLSEITYIKEIMKPRRMTILDCDTIIHNIHDVTNSDTIAELKFNGGGGTECAPVIEYCKKENATALIYFTDLFMSEYPHPIKFPLLWIVYNNPRRTRVNIGEITHYDITKGSK